jgi:hypothetical protein
MSAAHGVLTASVEQAAHVSGQDGIGRDLAELADGFVDRRGAPRGHRAVRPDECLFDIGEHLCSTSVLNGAGIRLTAFPCGVARVTTHCSPVSTMSNRNGMPDT